MLYLSNARAQEPASAAWQITGFDVNANIQQAERTLSAVAILNVTNVGRGTGQYFAFRINSKAIIKAVTVAGATANTRIVPESQGNAQRITVTLPGPVAPNSAFVINITYSLPVDSNTGLAAISQLGSQFLPLSFWYPTPNTALSVRGADTAPFRIVVNGSNVISSGSEKPGAGGGSTYEQTLNGQPFFVQGDWEKIEATGDGKNIATFIARGASPEEKKQAEAIMTLAANARSFYAGLMGPAPRGSRIRTAMSPTCGCPSP